jgi:DNA polymerase (family 10)
VFRSNQEIASVFQEMAELLLIQGGEPHRARAFLRSAKIIEELPAPAVQMIQYGNLQKQRGIGDGTLRRIKQILSSGGCDDLWRLRQSLPAGLRQLLQIHGLGPRTVRRLYHELGITGVDHLEIAARSGRLLQLRRFGPDRVDAIVRAIELHRRHQGKVPLSSALIKAGLIADAMRVLPGAIKVEIGGSCRRRKALIGDLDILVASEEVLPFIDALHALPQVVELVTSRDDGASVRLDTTQQVDLRVTRPEHWGAYLHYFTGAAMHNRMMRYRAGRRGLRLSEVGVRTRKADRLVTGGVDEREIFAALELPYIPPELREGKDEIAIAEQGRLPVLVSESDLRGDLHMHTVDSDGAGTALEMAEAAAALGYDYIAITDHSKSLSVANGLDEQRLIQQGRRLRELAAAAPVPLLAGIEVDILPDGSLDLDPSVLRRLDWVVASVHEQLSMPEEQMTERIVRAIESGLVDCVGHLTGRKLGRRDPYPVDVERVLMSALRTGVAVEVNGHPLRMDVDEVICRRARELGVMMVIDSDAHAPANLTWRELAMAMARRGWLEPANVLNTRSLDDIRAWRHERRRRYGIAMTVLPEGGSPAPVESPGTDDELVTMLQQKPLPAETLDRLDQYLKSGDDSQLAAALQKLAGDSGNPLQLAFNLLISARASGSLD